MLKTRIIPTLLWKNFGLVKGIGFESWRGVGSVLPSIKVYNSRDVDELFLLDICGNQDLHDPEYEEISDFTDHCFVPFAFGGGISNIQQIQRLLEVGADKISLNSAIFQYPSLLDEAAKRFGTQCIVASIDAKFIDGEYFCFSHSGTTNTQNSPVKIAKEVEARGAGEILVTSIDRDGTMKGYDIKLIEQVAGSVNIPVIASGGAGGYEDMELALKNGGASAVAAASIFHFTEKTPEEAKKFLSKKGYAVRLPFVEN